MSVTHETRRGGLLSSAGAGRIQGYLVVFGSADQPDLAGEYFTAQTDFALQPDQTTPLYYQHGLDPTLGQRPIGQATLRADAVGVWLEGQLFLRDQYEQALAALVQQGKLGLSSGTAAHLVEKVGGRITRWPLGLDASLTPTPAEPRAQAHPLKFTTNVSVLQGEPPMTQPLTHTDDRFAQLQGRLDGFQQALQGILTAPAVGNGAGIATPALAEAAPPVAALKAYLRKGQRGLTDTALKAALNEGTASQGGYLVPAGYSDELVTARRNASILRAAGARVIRVSGSSAYKVPTMTDSAAATRTGEGAVFDEKEPTFAEVQFTPYKYTKLVKLSDEMLADSRFPIENLLLEDAAQAFAAAENSDFTNGTGSAQPQGITTGASLGATASGVSPTADNLIDLYHSLSYLYRQNAVWLMNDSVLKDVRKLKDSTGQYLWQPGLVAGQPHTLLGRPVFINNALPTPGANARPIIFGDLHYYWIVDWAEMEVKRLDELYAANGQVGYRWYARMDARVMLPEAIKALQWGAGI